MNTVQIVIILLFQLFFCQVVLCQYQEAGCFPKDQTKNIKPVQALVSDLETCKQSCDLPYFALNYNFKECFCFSRDDIQNYYGEKPNNQLQEIQEQNEQEQILEVDQRRRNLKVQTIQNKDMFNTGYIGAGFSYDTLQMTREKCFKTRQTTITSSSSNPEMNKAYTFTEIMQEFQSSIRMHIGFFPIFRTSLKLSYENQIKDTATSFSINFYQFIQRTITGQLKGYGTDALTDFGKGIYQDGENPYFGIICGDEYVTKYAEGGLLVMSLNLKFASESDKKTFQSKFHLGIGMGFFAVTVKISQTYQITQVQGQTQVLAFQQGGNPAQLSQIFALDDQFTCDFLNMDNCQTAAKSLINYAANVFPEQFSEADNTGYIPLGEKFAEFKPVKFIGLKKNNSIVYQNIKQARKDIENQINENTYFKEHLEPILNNYSVQLSQDLQNQVQNAYDKAVNNLNVLINLSFPLLGIQGCFERPDECPNIYENMKKKLNPIQYPDLEFLDLIKYTIPLPPDLQYSSIYFDGNQTNTAPLNPPLTQINSLIFNQTHYLYDIVYTSQDGEGNDIDISQKGEFISEIFNNFYTGSNYVQGGAFTAQNVSATISPFYFEPKYYPNCLPLYLDPIISGLNELCYLDGTYVCQSPYICMFTNDQDQGKCVECVKGSDCPQDQFCQFQQDGEGFCEEQVTQVKIYGHCDIDGKFKCRNDLFCQSIDVYTSLNPMGKCVPCQKNSDCDQDKVCQNFSEDLTEWRCVAQSEIQNNKNNSNSNNKSFIMEFSYCILILIFMLQCV